MNNSDGAGRAPLNLMSLASGQPDAHMLRDLLREVIDPEIGINIVDLDLIYDIACPATGSRLST